MDAEELIHAGASEQARLLRDGQVSSRELIEATLAQIDRLDPVLNAFRVVLADQALARAREVDDARTAGADLPLLGVPVAVKDDMDVVGEVTAWGTDAYGEPKAHDSDVVARLRTAGAIVIGKTNVPELTVWPWTASPTWGVTRNPWDTTRTPGGSSGGSAVAAATGMCGVALGSDGGGSIRYPAALTGLFGLKPQRDRIPLGPEHRDAWNGLTVHGPLARTVRDAALVLDVTADDVPDGGFTAAVDGPIGRLKIAVSFAPPPGSMARLTDARRRAVEDTADLLRSLGHDVFEQQIDYGLGTLWNTTVRYVAGVHHDAGTLARPERLATTTRRLARLGGRIPARSLRRQRGAEQALAARINAIFDRADVVLTPMTAAAPPLLTDVAGKGLLQSLRLSNVSAWAGPWNAIGQPAAAVPAGVDGDGLPMAVQLCGRAGDEATLLGLAAQLETARPWAGARLSQSG